MAICAKKSGDFSEIFEWWFCGDFCSRSGDFALKHSGHTVNQDQPIKPPRNKKRVADENVESNAKTRKRAAFGDLTNVSNFYFFFELATQWPKNRKKVVVIYLVHTTYYLDSSILVMKM